MWLRNRVHNSPPFDPMMNRDEDLIRVGHQATHAERNDVLVISCDLRNDFCRLCG